MGEALVFFSLNDHVSEEHIRARDFPKWQQLKHVHQQPSVEPARAKATGARATALCSVKQLS